MNSRSIDERVETLEHAVGALMALPTEVAVLRVESRAFHDEMRLFQEVVATNFTRLENAMRAGDEETRRTLRQEVREGDEETRRQMREGDEEVRRLMLLLHDKVMARFDALERR